MTSHYLNQWGLVYWCLYALLSFNDLNPFSWMTWTQCLKLSHKSCRSSCFESQIINIKSKKNQQKVPGPHQKLSASDLWEFPTLHDLFVLSSLCHGCSVLMSWWHKEPGHQQSCYWPSFPKRFPHQYTKITTVFWGHRLIIFIHQFILVFYHYIPVTSTIQHILIMIDHFNGI